VSTLTLVSLAVGAAIAALGGSLFAVVNHAILPAWTIDGSRIAVLEKTGRKKFTLMTLAVHAG